MAAAFRARVEGRHCSAGQVGPHVLGGRVCQGACPRSAKEGGELRQVAGVGLHRALGQSLFEAEGAQVRGKSRVLSGRSEFTATVLPGYIYSMGRTYSSGK